MRPMILVSVLAVAFVAASHASAGASTPAGASQTAHVVRVASPHVCMVNDRDMGTSQIPVDVEGRRYYGCCEMCKERLAKDSAVRSATDPVSGRKVDKAKAVIGRLADGRVLYFDNEANLTKYARQTR